MISHDITTIIHFAIDTNNTEKIIFFVENLSHFRFIENLFNYFYKKNSNIHLICLDLPFGERKYENKNLKIDILKNDIEKIKTLKNLTGDLFITTTPSIGTSIFPKSIMPKTERPKYVYVFHSLVSPNEMYVKGSFNGFDILLSPSNTISEQLSPLISENAKIYTTGYLLFDNIDKFKYKNSFSGSILVAPTWGSRGLKQIINNIDNIQNFINSLNLTPVFRPHPMTPKSELNKINFQIDNGKDLNNLHTYKYLITDYSGIALEFFYLTGRPVIFLNVPKKVKRKIPKLSHDEKKFLLIENEMRNIIGRSFSIEELDKVNSFPDIEFNNAELFISKINTTSKSLDTSLSVLNF
tara:strand:+ start:960 stop:2018 length:1059 start_codon:yes stop_codon:yes gene_type:complete